MDEEPTAVTGVVRPPASMLRTSEFEDDDEPAKIMPPVSATQRDALLELKAQVERTTAMHEQVGAAIDALARAQRNMGRAVNDLLVAIGAVLKAQEADSVHPQRDVLLEEVRSSGPTDWRRFAQEVVADDTGALMARLPEHVRDAIEQDRLDNPRGHPCRDCGRYFDEHRSTDSNCRGWR